MNKETYTVKAKGRTASGLVFEIATECPQFATYYRDPLYHDNEITDEMNKIAQQELNKKAGEPVKIIHIELIHS